MQDQGRLHRIEPRDPVPLPSPQVGLISVWIVELKWAVVRKGVELFLPLFGAAFLCVYLYTHLLIGT